MNVFQYRPSCYFNFAHLDMHHLVFGINFQIHSVSLTVLSRFTSSSTCQPISLIIPALVIHHSFTLSLQAQNLTFQQILPTVDFFYLLDCLTITGLDRTYHAHHLFLVTHFFVYSVW